MKIPIKNSPALDAVSEAIDYTLSERSELLKKHFYIYRHYSETLPNQEKETLLSSLTENEEKIQKTSERLKNLEYLFTKITSC